MSIDEENRRVTHKVLIIFFIVIIVLINLEFLLRYIYLKSKRCLKNFGHCIRVSTAMGSIFLALFSLVVLTRIEFGEYKSMSCRTITIAGVYMELIFPFVFGSSLVLQGLSLYLYQSRFYTIYVAQSTPRIVFLAFVLSAVPWILGLTVICPLALVGIEWDDGCSGSFTKARNVAMLIVGIILPASLALLFSIVVYCKMQRATVYNQTRTSSDESLIDAGNEYTLQDPTEMIPVSNEDTLSTAYNSPLPGSGGAGDFPENGNIHFIQRFQVVALGKRCLIWSSLIFFFSVMPRGLYGMISMLIQEHDQKTDLVVILFEICYWAFFLYPALVPIVWRRQIQG